MGQLDANREDAGGLEGLAFVRIIVRRIPKPLATFLIYFTATWLLGTIALLIHRGPMPGIIWATDWQDGSPFGSIHSKEDCGLLDSQSDRLTMISTEGEEVWSRELEAGEMPAISMFAPGKPIAIRKSDSLLELINAEDGQRIGIYPDQLATEPGLDIHAMAVSANGSFTAIVLPDEIRVLDRQMQVYRMIPLPDDSGSASVAVVYNNGNVLYSQSNDAEVLADTELKWLFSSPDGNKTIMEMGENRAVRFHAWPVMSKENVALLPVVTRSGESSCMLVDQSGTSVQPGHILPADESASSNLWRSWGGKFGRVNLSGSVRKVWIVNGYTGEDTVVELPSSLANARVKYAEADGGFVVIGSMWKASQGIRDLYSKTWKLAMDWHDRASRSAKLDPGSSPKMVTSLLFNHGPVLLSVNGSGESRQRELPGETEWMMSDTFTFHEGRFYAHQSRKLKAFTWETRMVCMELPE
ncbi:hypothetical protein KDL29_02625 [bacterium]|nr:hypothetical protein [bacterium]